MIRPKKCRILISSASLAWLSLTTLAGGAVYSTDFNAFTDGNIAGQDGWAVNATTLETFKPGEIIPSFGFSPWGSKSASIGYSTGLSVPKVDVSRTYPGGESTPLLPSGGGPNTTFRALFYLVDSISTASNPPEPVTDAVRDTFGFRLKDTSGNNLFSFTLEPDTQKELPENDLAFHYMSWSTGTNSPVVIFPGPPRLATEEFYFYNLIVTFSATAGNDVAFTATVDGSTVDGSTVSGIRSFSGIIPNAASSGIATFGAFWETSNAAKPGSNYMLFDNLSLVPEPSAALLWLLGASFSLVRRRRA